MHAWIIAAAAAAAAQANESKPEHDHPDPHHQIDEIIVSALPLSRTVNALTQVTSVITGDELTRAQNTSIGEAVAEELGVSATYFGPIASRPVIRGQYGERVLMLSNGLDALDASALSEDHATTVEPILTERIEIIRGPATLIYGSGAAGGIVNVVDSRIHEQPLDKTVSGALSLSNDTAIGAETGAFKIDVGNDDYIAHFDYMRRRTDNIEIPGFAESEILRALEGELDGEPEGVLENSDSETTSSGFALTFLGEGDDFVGISVSRYDTNYGIPGGHAHEHEEGEHEEGEEEEEEIIRIDMEQVRYDLRGQMALDGWFEMARFKVAQNVYEHVELEGPEIGTRYENDGTDVRLDLLHRAGDQLAGTIGLQYKRIDLNAVGEEAFVPPSDTDQFGLYAYQEWTMRSGVVLQGSARIERQRIETAAFDAYSDSAFGASLGAIVELGDSMSLSSNLAITERHPNATELFAFGPHLAVQRFERGSVANGNGELGKETSVNLDVTLRGELDAFSWTVTAFNNDVSDYILLSPTSEFEDGLQVFDFRQADAQLYGLEAELVFDILENATDHVHARLFTDFVHAEEDSGAYLPRITPLRFGGRLHWTRGGLDTSLSVARHAKQENLAANELRTEAYTLIEAEVSYHWDDPDVMLFLQGVNLGDEDARRHTSPLKDVAPLPGRAIRAGLRWDF